MLPHMHPPPLGWFIPNLGYAPPQKLKTKYIFRQMRLYPMNLVLSNYSMFTVRRSIFFGWNIPISLILKEHPVWLECQPFEHTVFVDPSSDDETTCIRFCSAVPSFISLSLFTTTTTTTTRMISRRFYHRVQ